MLPYKGCLMFPYSNAGMSALVNWYLETLISRFCSALWDWITFINRLPIRIQFLEYRNGSTIGVVCVKLIWLRNHIAKFLVCPVHAHKLKSKLWFLVEWQVWRGLLDSLTWLSKETKKNQEQFANTRIFIVFSNYILHSPRKLKSWAPFCTHTTPLINEEKQ